MIVSHCSLQDWSFIVSMKIKDFFDKVLQTDGKSIKKLIQIAEGYDTTPGHLLPDAIQDRLRRYINVYGLAGNFTTENGKLKGGPLTEVRGVNLTLAKIDVGDDYLLIDFRDVYRMASDYFETENIPNLHTYIIRNKLKVLVNEEVLEKITTICPEFFDGMDLEEAPITNKDLNIGCRVTGYLSPSARFAAGGKNMQYAATSVKILKKEPEAECPVCGFVDKISVSKCKKCGAIFEDNANIGS